MSDYNSQFIAQHQVREEFFSQQDEQRERDVIAAEKRYINACVSGIGFDLADHVSTAMSDLHLTEKHWRVIAECVASQLRLAVRMKRYDSDEYALLSFIARDWAEKEIGS